MAKRKVQPTHRVTGVLPFVGRQARHLIQVGAIILTHLGVKLLAKHTHQEHEWWVIWLERSSAAFAVFGFIFTTVVDLIVECAEVIRSPWERIRSRR